MPHQMLDIVDGPDKPALQWAVTYPEKERVSFRTGSRHLDAQLTRMSELSNGFGFELQGVVTSGDLAGRPFRGSYNVETRAGSLVLDDTR